MPANESAAHLALKTAALAWAVENGYSLVATEVRIPTSGFRADVAAVRPTPMRKEADLLPGRTVIFECKQARADLLKDSRCVEKALAELKVLEERRRKLEALLGVHFPTLRRGDSLFPEYESADLDGLQHAPYQRIRRRMAALQNQLYGGTKFDKLRRWASAHLLYLVTPPGLAGAAEVPDGWGLLEAGEGSFREVRQPVLAPCTPRQCFHLLQNITRAASREVLRRANVPGSSWRNGTAAPPEC